MQAPNACSETRLEAVCLFAARSLRGLGASWGLRGSWGSGSAGGAGCARSANVRDGHCACREFCPAFGAYCFIGLACCSACGACLVGGYRGRSEAHGILLSVGMDYVRDNRIRFLAASYQRRLMLSLVRWFARSKGASYQWYEMDLGAECILPDNGSGSEILRRYGAAARLECGQSSNWIKRYFEQVKLRVFSAFRFGMGSCSADAGAKRMRVVSHSIDLN